MCIAKHLQGIILHKSVQTAFCETDIYATLQLVYCYFKYSVLYLKATPQTGIIRLSIAHDLIWFLQLMLEAFSRILIQSF